MRIIIKWSNGKVTNTHLLDVNAKEHAISQLKQKLGADIVEMLETEDNISFENRKFRDAYDIKGGTVDICLDKAKEVVLNNIRAERAEKFVELGIPFKLDSDLEAAILPAEKIEKLKELRDITAPLKTDAVIPLETLEQVNINNITELLGDK